MKTVDFKITPFLLLFLLSCSFSYSQLSYPQEVLDTMRIGKKTPDNLLIFKRILEKSNNKSEWGRYYASYGYYYLSKTQNMDSILFYAEKALDFYKNNDYTFTRLRGVGLMQANYEKGVVLYDRERYLDALPFFLKAQELAKTYSKYVGYYTSRIGELHVKIGNMETALVHFLELSKDSSYLKNNRAKSATFLKLGLIYSNLGKNDLAKYFYRKTLKVDYLNNQIAANNNLGTEYVEEGIVDSALHYFERAKKLRTQLKKERPPISRMYYSAHDAYLDINEGKIAQAILVLTTIKDSIEKKSTLETESFDLMMITLGYLGLAYEKNGNYEKAKEVLGERLDYMKGFNQQVLNQQLQNLHIQYETKEKEDKINSLEEINKAKNTIIKQRSYIIYGLIIMVIMAIVIVLVFYKNSQTKENYKRLNLRQRLLLTQMNPHFIFNSINIASSMIDKAPKKSKQYLLNFSVLMRTILENSRNEYVSLEDEINMLNHYLILQSKFSKTFTYSIEIFPKMDSNQYCIPHMLLQPVVENAVKHGIKNIENGRISIKFHFSKDYKILSCEIIDNGSGTKSNKNGQYGSLSLKIIKERLALYGKKFKVETSFKIDSMGILGTRVTLTVPVLND